MSNRLLQGCHNIVTVVVVGHPRNNLVGVLNSGVLSELDCIILEEKEDKVIAHPLVQ